MVRGPSALHHHRHHLVSVPSERGSGGRLSTALSSNPTGWFQSPLSGAVVRGLQNAIAEIGQILFQSPLSGAVVRGPAKLEAGDNVALFQSPLSGAVVRGLE